MHKGLILILSLFLLSGCTGTEDKFKMNKDSNVDTTRMEEAIRADKRITKAISFLHEKEMIVAINLKTFSRFKKDKIEKKLQKEIAKDYEDFDVIVSADMKIVQEVNKISKLEDQAAVEKKIKAIKMLTKEET